jgi:TonB family protein
MRNIRLKTIGAFGASLVLASVLYGQQSSSVVKKADGQTFRGVIQGRIVMKQPLAKGRTLYFLWYGKDIDEIDGHGVHVRKDVATISGIADYEGRALGDVEVVETIARNQPSGANAIARLPNGKEMLIVRLVAPQADVASWNLLGEFRIDPRSGKGRLIPAIEIVTSTGIVAVPLAEIKGLAHTASGEAARLRSDATKVVSSQETSSASPLRVDAAVQAGKIREKVSPQYPPLAKQSRIEGVVVLDATIDKGGRIATLTVKSGHPLLVPAAMEAVKQWIFEPTLLDGKPVEVVTQIKVAFNLLQDDSKPASDRAESAVQGTPPVEKKEAGMGLHDAVKSGDVEKSRDLLDRGAEVNGRDNDGMAPLCLAAAYGRAPVAELLVRRGADINAKCREAFTPLHLAAWNEHEEIADLLLKQGAEVNLKASPGVTPLWLAASKGNVPIVRALLSRGADLTIMDKGGYTPFHEACGGGHLEAARLLLAKGANPTLQADNEHGWRPLHFAVLKGSKEVVEFLLANGASPEEKGKDGWTPLDMAERLGRTEIIALLKKAGH